MKKKDLLDQITKLKAEIDRLHECMGQRNDALINMRIEWDRMTRVSDERIAELRAQRDELHERMHGKRGRDLSSDREWLAMVSSFVEEKGLK